MHAQVLHTPPGASRETLLKTLRRGARLALGRADLAGWRVVTVRRRGGDQAGDGQVGLVEVVAASQEPLEDAPLLVLGVGVLYADPF